MQTVDLELDGKRTAVTKDQLFALAQEGRIGPDSIFYYNGQPKKVGIIKNIVFGTKKEQGDEFDDLGDMLSDMITSDTKRMERENAPVEEEKPNAAPAMKLVDKEQEKFASSKRDQQMSQLESLEYMAMVKQETAYYDAHQSDMTCIKCGTPIARESEFCPSCGRVFAPNKVICGFLNFLLPGLGLFILKKHLLGSVILGVTLLLDVIDFFFMPNAAKANGGLGPFKNIIIMNIVYSLVSSWFIVSHVHDNFPDEDEEKQKAIHGMIIYLIIVAILFFLRFLFLK